MAAGDATTLPVKNQAFRVTFPIFDADGDLVTGAAGLDSEVSKDGGSFADCTNEATEIGASGVYTLDLTATEMNADTVAVIVKTSTSGAKTTPMIFYPADRDVNDLATQASVNTVDDFLDTEITDIRNRLPAALVGGRMDSSVGAMAADVVTATAIATGAIDADAIAADAITNAKIAANAIGASEIADDAITAAKIANGAIDAATFAAGAIDNAAIAADAIGASELAAGAATEIADAVWATAVPGAFGAGTAGKVVGDNVNATISSRATQTSVDTIDDFVDTEIASIISTLATILAAVDTEVAAIKAVTDLLPNGGALTLIQSDLDNIQTRLPAALVGGRMDSSIPDGMITNAKFAPDAIDAGVVANNTITAGKFDAGAINANAIASDALTAAKIAADFGAEIADAILSRPISNVEASAAFRTLFGAISKLVNRGRINGGNLEVFKTDDTTVLATQAVTTDGNQEPVVELNTA